MADVVLLVSELVTNAVQHGPEGGRIELKVGSADRVLRVEVHNTGEGPRSTPERRPEEPGLGLKLVDALSDRWGMTAGPPRLAWFEIELD
jgi:anti-sigma regulatory factor (Ser/Thr protein kinase)